MAIITVLAAVAIPTFGRQLETARETADLEIFRSAYTEALTVVLMDAVDGTLDGNNGETEIATTPAAFATGGKYTVTLATMDDKAAIKQAQEGWQYVDGSIVGVNIEDVKKGNTSIEFTFAIDDSTGVANLTAAAAKGGGGGSATPSTPNP